MGRLVLAAGRCALWPSGGSAVRFGVIVFYALWTICAGALVSGCSVRLAPDFDRTVVGGLTKANDETLKLFASVSSGASKITFSKRKPAYDSLIGSFDALRIQAQARPNPRPQFLQVLGLGPSPTTKPEDIQVLDAPTPEILSTIVYSITEMRDTDQAVGLNANIVSGFKREYETSIDQALIYEKALER